MHTVGSSWWIVGPPALPTETVRHRWAANHSATAHRAIGGRLYLTTRRLVFAPNRVEWCFGGQPWAVFLHDIAAADRLDRTMSSPHDGSLRARLRITLTDARTELLVVSHLDAVIATLTAALSPPRDTDA